MKKSIQTFLIIMPVIFCYSCNNNGNSNNQSNDSIVTNTQSDKSLPDIVGHYKLPNDGCDVELFVTKENGIYIYNIKDKRGIIDIGGEIQVKNVSDEYYVVFGFPESFTNRTGEGQFKDNTITIQNYGNAESKFEIFSECQEKYLEFKKVSNDGTQNNESSKIDINLPDISGVYKMPANTCGFELIITKDNDEYNYNMKGKNGIVDIFGKVSVTFENEAYSVNFELPPSFPSKIAGGQFENGNTITIQNYGNAQNQFQHFKDCDEKYMEFKKN